MTPTDPSQVNSPGITLGELAVRFGCELRGDPGVRVTHVAALQEADAESIGFVSNAKYLRHLTATRAAAVIVDAKTVEQCPVAALIAKNPYATFARIATLLHPRSMQPAGVHSSAIVDPTAVVDATAWIGPHCVIGPRVRIGARAEIGPGSIIMADAELQADTRLVARVTICERVRLGERCIVHPGAVIGADGFGNAMDAGAWVKVPQLGAVIVGNDVEIGCNTTIDRGAIGDTVLEDGVRLDNLIQIAHNVRVGAHTAMASGVGVAGSTIIGKYCMIGGKAGIANQLEICDNVIIGGHATVGGTIDKPGFYLGALQVDEANVFRRNSARFGQLDKLAKDVRRLMRSVFPGERRSDTDQSEQT